MVAYTSRRDMSTKSTTPPVRICRATSRPSSSGLPVASGLSRIPTWKPSPVAARMPVEHLDQGTHPVVEGAAVAVAALVALVEELGEEEAVRAVELDTVEARPLGPHRGRDIGRRPSPGPARCSSRWPRFGVVEGPDDPAGQSRVGAETAVVELDEGSGAGRP